MPIGEATPPKFARARAIGLLVLRILLALVFFGAGTAKLTGQPMLVTEFDTIGFGQWFRYFTGGVEIIGAALLLVPRTSPFGAVLLCGVAIGAFIAQFTVLKMDVVHTIVLAALLAIVAYAERRKLNIYRAADVVYK